MAPKRLPDGRVAVLLSAQAEELVRADARAIADYLDRFPATTVTEVARHLHRIRRVRSCRAVVRAADSIELVDGLRALAAGREHPLVACSAHGTAPRQAFVFPGQGGQWPGMGAVAYQELPAYRAATDACAAAFEDAGVVSPLRYLTAVPAPIVGAEPQFCETEIEGAQFVHAVALAEVWRSCGVLPDLTVGHSLGEVAAAYIAGSITLSDAVAVVAARAGVVDRLPGCHAVAALGISEREASPLIAATDGWLELSVVNAASTIAVSGDREAVLAIVDRVRSGGRFAREITVGFPVHTSVLEPLHDELLAQLPNSEFTEAPVQFIGGTAGDVVAPGTTFADYWYANLRHTVRFDRAIESAIRCGARSFIELSAHPTLLFAIGQNCESSADLPDGPAVLVGSARRREPLVDALSANIVTAAVADPGYAWGELCCGGPVESDVGLRGFPNAPMRAVPMWAHPEPLPPVPGLTPGPTIAVERWDRMTPSLPAAGQHRHLAVLDLGAHGPCAQMLRAAIDSHPATELTAPQDAELVVVIAPDFEHTDAARAAGALADLVGAGLLDYPTRGGPRCQSVCLVTAGAEQVGQADTVPSAGQAALAAMHRSIGFEYPDQTFSHLDLPSWDVAPAAGGTIVDALLAGPGETALRSCGSGYALLQRTLGDAPVAPGWSLDSGVLDDVVITGGAGAIGLHYARYFAEHGARRIVLLSRRAADPAALAALAAPHGTVLISPPCDITDDAQLALVAAEYGGTGASLVVHAAGKATFGTAARLTSVGVADNFAAKVLGLAQLMRLWPIRPDTRTLLCSSVSGVWGGRGHVGYSAANRLLDVMAAQLRATGRHCVAVKFGLWQGTTDGTASPGIVDAASVAQIERSGLRQMPPLQAIEASLYEYRVDPLVFSADEARFQIFLASTKSEPGDRPVDGNLTIVDAVRTQLAAVLGMPQAGELNLAQSLFDLGVDSMLAVDLRKRLKRVTGRTVPLAALLDEITGDELVAKLGRAGEHSYTAQKVDISRD
ncbi:mycobactin polyketide synthase MbtD [Mycobacterium decipiens]|uniref:Polyketide synthase n=1 Tax=Mycobacterium decipiens TaxID=1430326 RepID=A0A1X2LRW4_9MYCO|nr:mycobactin polyketide synthase MbtD [Mycobacterium decipiens]OSC38581.1 polyketide synthase [Mycobacterium decipiens]